MVKLISLKYKGRYIFKTGTFFSEEEQKRSKTNAIQYSYDVPQNPEMENEGIPTVEQAEEEYVPPPILDVPVDIAIVSKYYSSLKKYIALLYKLLHFFDLN